MSDTPEDRRRAAPDGPPEDDGDMRQDVNIHRVFLPPLTARLVNAGIALLVIIAGWGGLNIELMRQGMQRRDEQQTARDKQQADQNAAILVEIAGIKATVAINSAGIAGLESRTEKLEGRP
jgi:hypothetical protein